MASITMSLRYVLGLILPPLMPSVKTVLTTPPICQCHVNLKMAPTWTNSEPQHDLTNLMIPVIDIAALQGNHVNECEHRRVITEIAHACQNWGAFQVVNHGIHPDVIQRARDQARQVFELPNETRWKAKRPPGSLSGYGNGAVIAEADNNTIASEAITFGYPRSEADVIASKLWPHGTPNFGASIDEYNAASHKLASKIIGLMVESLKPQGTSTHFQPYLTEESGVLRINNYPASNHPDRDIGLPPHIDDTLLTIVHQGNVEGLELVKDGQWVPVPPRSDVLIVLVAAVCQILTNGTYKAVLHRAVPNPYTPRLSMVYSAYPPANISIIPAPEFVSPANPPLYKPFTWSEYLSGQVSHILNPIDGLQPEQREAEAQNDYYKSSGNETELLHQD